MTYDVSHLTQDLPVEEDGGIGPSTKSPSFPTDALSRADSIDSISGVGSMFLIVLLLSFLYIVILK